MDDKWGGMILNLIMRAEVDMVLLGSGQLWESGQDEHVKATLSSFCREWQIIEDFRTRK